MAIVPATLDILTIFDRLHELALGNCWSDSVGRNGIRFAAERFEHVAASVSLGLRKQRCDGLALICDGHGAVTVEEIL